MNRIGVALIVGLLTAGTLPGSGQICSNKPQSCDSPAKTAEARVQCSPGAECWSEEKSSTRACCVKRSAPSRDCKSGVSSCESSPDGGSEGTANQDPAPSGCSEPTSIVPSNACSETVDERSSNEPCRTAIRANLILVELEEVRDSGAANRVSDALRAIKGVFRVAVNSEERLLTILTYAEPGIDAERVLQYLRLAGYDAKEASDEKYDTAVKRQQPPSKTALTGSGQGARSPVKQSLRRIDGALTPLIEAFNKDREKVRLVATLSPT